MMLNELAGVANSDPSSALVVSEVAGLATSGSKNAVASLSGGNSAPLSDSSSLPSEYSDLGNRCKRGLIAFLRETWNKTVMKRSNAMRASCPKADSSAKRAIKYISARYTPTIKFRMARG
jgi:hypothetical protein